MRPVSIIAALDQPARHLRCGQQFTIRSHEIRCFPFPRQKMRKGCGDRLYYSQNGHC